MSLSETRPVDVTGGFVRPRYTDGEVDEPLPLEDRFRELVLDPDAPPARVLIAGRAGSGVTTTLGWLAEIAGERAVGVDDLGDDLGPLLAEDRILFLDFSPTPADAARWTRGLNLVLAARPRLAEVRVVIGGAFAPDGFGAGAVESSLSTALAAAGPVHVLGLAPWSRDDLLELLGSCPRLRAARGRLFEALGADPDVAELVRHPRAARYLVEAALALGEDEPATRTRLYANVLDALHAGTIAALRELVPRDATVADALAAIRRAGEARDPRELAELFQLTRAVAARLARGEVVPEGLGPVPLDLALPGLHHFIQAGERLQAIARGELGPGVPPREHFPYLRELLQPGVAARLRAALTDGEADGKADAAAATILWAAGEAPPLSCTRRPLRLGGAVLDEIELPGGHLVGVDLGRASLREARLAGARLLGATLVQADLGGAVLDGADLADADFFAARAARASLRGAWAEGVRLVGADLRGAALEGAHLKGAHLSRTKLDEAALSGASLTHATLDGCAVDGATFDDADLTGARLESLDLRRAAFEPRRLVDAQLLDCDVAEQDLEGVEGPGALLVRCDLSATRFDRAALEGARFSACRAHEASFVGADLRRASFAKVNFHAGSSRAGLLLDQAPMEGSKTGFYSEGATDDAWAPPESIRTADFRGADLREATFVDCDLFRVDLRGARLSPELEAQARQAGAILEG